MKKHLLRTAGSLLLLLCLLTGCGQQSSSVENSVDEAVELVKDIPTTQYFTDEAVSEDDIETILLSGVNAPSAMNQQPWHFSVITSSSVLQQIADDMSNAMPSGAAPAGAPENGADAENAPPADDKAVATQNTSAVKAGIADAPLAIVVSCSTGAGLNAGLACQNMSVTAQLLGYGSKIISSPTIALNGEKQEEYRAVLGIPEDYTAVAILLIGYEDTTVDQTADTYSGATERNPMADVVTYVEE